MGFRMIPPKRVKKAKTKNSQEVLNRLEEYLENGCDEPVQILCGFWEDQQDAITYQELRQAVRDGELDQKMLQLWSQDYSVLVTGRLSSLWTNAIKAGMAGQPVLDGIPLKFDMQVSGILNWIQNRGAEFVTVSTKEQRAAIAALLTKKMKDRHTVDELSRLIRPCIGLTERDAKAAVKLYDSIVETLIADHPRMKQESIREKALDATQKYAERKHRARAMTIAQTESAFAYNRGADEGIRQAQAAGYLGVMRKRWSTSGDDGVCAICNSLEGAEIDMDSEFEFKGRILFPGHRMLPPAHPRCGCAIEYIEAEPPAFIDTTQMKVDITQIDSFREYSTKEIENMARQTEDIISSHISVPSKWSGTIVVNDEGIRNPDGHITSYGKLWNCDILTKHETAPAIILHEQLHARSISHYGPGIYRHFSNIEESSVQLMAEEICRKNDIEIIESDYQTMIDSLKQIGQYIGVHKTDYDFAKFLIEMPVAKRLDWISDKLYATLGRNESATIEEYQSWSSLLDILYTKE